MLRRITQNKQVTLPREFLQQLNLREGDYVALECDGNSIRLRALASDDLNAQDCQRLAARLDRVREERGIRVPDSEAARNHLKAMME